MKNKILSVISLLLCLCLVLGIFPSGLVFVGAATPAELTMSVTEVELGENTPITITVTGGEGGLSANKSYTIRLWKAYELKASGIGAGASLNQGYRFSNGSSFVEVGSIKTDANGAFTKELTAHISGITEVGYYTYAIMDGWSSVALAYFEVKPDLTEDAKLTLSSTTVELGENKPLTITVTGGQGGLSANKSYTIRMFKSYNAPEDGGMGIASGLNQSYKFANGYSNIEVGNVTTDENGAFTKEVSTHISGVTETGYYTYAIMDGWNTKATANFEVVAATQKATLTVTPTKVELAENKPITITVTGGNGGLDANKSYTIRMFKSYNPPEDGGMGITSGLNQSYKFANGYSNIEVGNVTTDANGAFTKEVSTHISGVTETGYYTYAIMDGWDTKATANFEVIEASQIAELTLSATSVEIGTYAPITVTATSGNGGFDSNKTYNIRLFKSYNTPDEGGMGITSGIDQTYIFPSSGYNNISAGTATTDENGTFIKELTYHISHISEIGYYTYAIMDGWSTVATANFEVIENSGTVRFTNTETAIGKTFNLNYENVDLSLGTFTVMIYRFKEGWDFAVDGKNNYLKDTGYSTYYSLSSASGSVKVEASMLQHYGKGKYVAVLGGPSWSHYDEFVFEYDPVLGPHFTNTETIINSTFNLKYENLDLSVGDCTIMLYRFEEGWTFSSNGRTNYLKDSGYSTYFLLNATNGYVKIEGDLLKHYGAGKYVAVLGGPGWANYSEFLFEYNPTYSESVEGKKVALKSSQIQLGSTLIDVKCYNTSPNDWVAIYPKGFTDKEKYYDFIYCDDAQVNFPSGETNRYKLDENWSPLKVGEYEVVLYDESGVELSRVGFKVIKSNEMKRIALSSTGYVIGDKITLTASNLNSEDGDFIRIFKSSTTDYTKDYLFDSKKTGIKSIYEIDTTGWEKGDYTAILFTKNKVTESLDEFKFTLKNPDDKMVTLSKTSWFTDEKLVIDTYNWSAEDKDFMRIYKLPIENGYNSGFLFQTWGDYGKKQYSVDLNGWEAGKYCLIAWDHGDYSLPQVAYIEFNIETASNIEGDGNYTNDGSIITVEQNCKIDFTNLKHNEYQNKVFNGWVDTSGNPVKNGASFAAGTILTASYIDINTDPENYDFIISDVEIRTEGKLGLRFIVEKSNKLSETVDIVNYGTIALPAVVLNGTAEDPTWKELLCGEVYKYGDKELNPADILGLKTYKHENERMYYTCCLQGISTDDYDTQYVVRGYMHYRDCNGIDRVLYTDYSSANPYIIAKQQLSSDNELTQEQKQVLNKIVVTVNDAKKEKYSSLTKFDIRGTEKDPNTWIYQLGVGGIMFREVVVDSGKGGEEVNIVQVSDTHFNYINDLDRKIANPTVLSTARNRTFGKNGYVNSRKVLDYAITADQIVLTGDVFDYLSEGCVELGFKEFWDIVPSAMISVGNHEFLQCMQGNVPERLPVEERWANLESIWEHNLYYSSKVLDDKVMLIQLNNGERKFYDSQLKPLQDDLAIAREKGYAVLLFMHEPINTNNPESAMTLPIYYNDASNKNGFDFYNDPTNSFVGGSKADDDTKAVYDTILGNADIIKGVFNGHMHADYYTEILGTTPSGKPCIIPQYTSTGAVYDNGHIIKITVK